MIYIHSSGFCCTWSQRFDLSITRGYWLNRQLAAKLVCIVGHQLTQTQSWLWSTTQGSYPFSATVNLYGEILEHVASQQQFVLVLSGKALDLASWLDHHKGFKTVGSSEETVCFTVTSGTVYFLFLYRNPQLEYAGVMWSNYPVLLQDKLNWFQCKATEISLGHRL